MSQSPIVQPEGSLSLGFLKIIVLVALLSSAHGCQRKTRDQSEIVNRRINESTLNSEPLRQGLRNLQLTTQINKQSMANETRVLINAWLKEASLKSDNYEPTKYLDAFDSKDLITVGCQSPSADQLSEADIENLFQAKLMRRLSDWIVAQPIKDQVFLPMIQDRMSQLQPEEAVKLEQAYKLFDWTIRNVCLAPLESSQTKVRTRDPRMPLQDNGVGYTYLPWESALFSLGDFVMRGRVFGALATQQGIDTCWISIGSAPGAAGDLFAMGVLAGDQLLLLEPKLGLPILDPDTDRWATIQDVAKNEKILRRLNLPQYEYAIQQPAVNSVQLLIDATPFELSRRASLLEQSLLGDERMVVSIDADGKANRLGKAAPNATTSVWNLPLMAQLHNLRMRERLREVSPFAMRYNAEHFVWLVEGSIAEGRYLHLDGKFENTKEGELGALRTYFDTRVDDESLRRMAFNPDAQRRLGVQRESGEQPEAYEMRVMQAIAFYSRAKFDAAFLLAQLHFDRGDFKSSSYWLRERLIGDKRSERWQAHGWYLLARDYTEMGMLAEAEDALTKPAVEQDGGKPAYVVNPQDAGNRIRLRYLRRLIEAQGK